MTRKNYQRHRLFRVSLRQQPSLLSGSGDEKLYTELVSGSELNTGVGFGVMIMSSAKNDVQGKVGIHVSTDMGSSTEETWTTSATTAVKTSATTDYVGANGDVFIGSSTHRQTSS